MESNMMSRFTGVPLLERVKMMCGPFDSDPHVYNPPTDSGSHGSMKRSFFIMQPDAGVIIFTYDDSDEFRPTFKHHFDLANAQCLCWSPLASSLLCVKEKELTVMFTQPSCKEVNLKVPMDKEVALAGFSPHDNFIFLVFRRSDDLPQYKIEILGASTGKIRKTFNMKCENLSKSGFDDIITWGNNDSYLAYLVSRVLRIYDTERFCLVRRFENIECFSCSPSAPIVALFDDCTVKFIEVGSGSTVLHSKVINGVNIHTRLWQSAGDYLACVCLGTDLKTVFLVSLKSGMSEFITDQPGCDYIDLNWKGNGKEFAVYFGTNDGHSQLNFYSLQDDGQTLSHKIKTEKGMKARFLHWSPNGSYIVVQGPLDGPGELYFYDADNHQQLAFHRLRVYHLQWDSSSRFFVTQSHRMNMNDPVVRIWSPHGEKLRDVGPSLLIMRWCHKQSCATEDSMLIDDGGGGLGGDSSGNRDGEPATDKRPGDSVVEPASKLPRLV